MTAPADVDPVDAAQARALEDLCTALRTAGIASPEEKASLLVGCLGNVGELCSLNLARARGQYAQDLLAMPSAGWLALQRYAQAGGDAGIRVVELSWHLDPSDLRLRSGLKELGPSLAFVTSPADVRVPAQQEFRAEFPHVELVLPEFSGMPLLVESRPSLFEELRANLDVAVTRGKFQLARQCVRDIVRSGLPPVIILEALLCRMPLDNSPVPRKVFSPALSAMVDEEPAPLFYRMCCNFKPVVDKGMQPHLMQYETMRSALQQMLASHKLPIDELILICGYRHLGPEGEFTAAQLAMRRGHPGAAGALVWAVLLNGGTPERRQVLLNALGVDPQDVLDALSQPPWTRWLITREMRAGIASQLPALG